MAHLLQVEVVARPVDELHILQQCLVQVVANGGPQALVLQGEVVLPGLLPAGVAAVGLKLQHLPALPVVHALEVNARANGPVHGVGANAQLLLDLVQQVVGALGIPVHLVDKGEDGDVPHDAHLKELAGLGLHALAGVDDHHRRVGGHQRAVSVLGEVLVARGVQDVDAVAVVLKLHHRGGHGDAALLFNLHPVGDSVAGVPLALYHAGQGDGPAVEQEFFR